MSDGRLFNLRCLSEGLPPMNTLIDHAKSFASSTWMRTLGGRGEFAALKEQTAFDFPRLLPLDVCKALVSRIDEVTDDPGHPRVWRDAADSDRRIFQFERDCPDLVEHFEVDRRIGAIDDYLGLKTHCWLLMANRVVPKEGNLGSGGGLHRDSPFSHQIKCIWYLNDVSSENGPFHYAPGTNFNLLRTRNVYPLGQTRFEKAHDALVEVHARAGSLLVCDTKCVHGGKPMTSGVRYAVTLYTFTRPNAAEAMMTKLGLDPARA